MAKAKHIKCERCGTDIIQSNGAGRTRYRCKSCSPNYGAKTAGYRCLRCGVDIDQPAGRGRLREYCGYCRELRVRMSGVTYLVCLCGNRRWKRHAECDKCRRTKQCIRCGSNYIHSGQSGPSAHTCSTECRDVIKIRLQRLQGRRATRACSFCGSVSVVPERTNNSERDAFYCDIECCGDHKRFLYVQPSHQDKIGKTERDRVAKQKARELNQRRRKLHAGWSCCLGCGVARKDKRARMCVECTQEARRCRNARIAADRYHSESNEFTAICEYCLDPFTYRRHHSASSMLRKYCSKRCTKRAQKEMRQHLIRATGYTHSIKSIAVFKDDKWRCCSCGCKCIKPTGSNAGNEATLDHIHPLSMGGLHVRSNVQTLCRRCNTAKGNRMSCVQMCLPLR